MMVSPLLSCHFRDSTWRLQELSLYSSLLGTQKFYVQMKTGEGSKCLKSICTVKLMSQV